MLYSSCLGTQDASDMTLFRWQHKLPLWRSQFSHQQDASIIRTWETLQCCGKWYPFIYSWRRIGSIDALDEMVKETSLANEYEKNGWNFMRCIECSPAYAVICSKVCSLKVYKYKQYLYVGWNEYIEITLKFMALKCTLVLFSESFWKRERKKSYIWLNDWIKKKDAQKNINEIGVESEKNCENLFIKIIIMIIILYQPGRKRAMLYLSIIGLVFLWDHLFERRIFWLLQGKKKIHIGSSRIQDLVDKRRFFAEERINCWCHRDGLCVLYLCLQSLSLWSQVMIGNNPLIIMNWYKILILWDRKNHSIESKVHHPLGCQDLAWYWKM